MHEGSGRDGLALAGEYDAVLLVHRLHIVARGVELSSGCYTDAYLTRSPLDVEPPVFLLMQKYTADPGVMCTQVVHPLHHPVHLDLPWKREVTADSYVVVRDRAGDHHVRIRVVKGRKTLGGGDGHSPDPLMLPTRPGFVTRQGVGYSNTYSLPEAIQAALAHMEPPSNHSPVPDELSYFEIASMGVEIGGFAGLNRLRVVVQTFDPE